VVLTGDYLFANGGAHDAIVEPVARLAAALAAPDGILGVLGITTPPRWSRSSRKPASPA